MTRATQPPRSDDRAGELNAEEMRRYSRHFVLPLVGIDGQRRLKSSSVLLVGAGGLGSPAAMYLAAAGVGRIGLVDDDAVDLSNLQRQIIHRTASVGQPKLESARAAIAAINPHVSVETHDTRLTSANALDLLGSYDLTIDGTDNFPTRYLINDASVLLGKQYVYGAVIRFEGQASVFGTAGGPCYRCLFREPPPPELVPSCADGGVLGVLPGLIGMIQATEALKIMLGIGDGLSGRLLLVDGLRMRFHEVSVQPDPECPACGTRELTALIDYERFCGITGARDAAGDDAPLEMTPAELRGREPGGHLLLDVREPWEHRIAHLRGATLVPMGSLESAVATLPRDRDIIVYCHHGIRSRSAAEFLRRAGVTRARSLAGGIDRWSREVDASIPRY